MKKENKMATIHYGFESRSGTSILYVPSFIIRILELHTSKSELDLIRL